MPLTHKILLGFLLGISAVGIPATIYTFVLLWSDFIIKVIGG